MSTKNEQKRHADYIVALRDTRTLIHRMRPCLVRLLCLGAIVIFIRQIEVVPHKFHVEHSSVAKRTACNMSLIESDHLLCESDERWHERRAYYFKQHERNRQTMNEYRNYFDNNWYREFRCPNEIRLGEGDGGKWVSFSKCLTRWQRKPSDTDECEARMQPFP